MMLKRVAPAIFAAVAALGFAGVSQAGPASHLGTAAAEAAATDAKIAEGVTPVRHWHHRHWRHRYWRHRHWRHRHWGHWRYHRPYYRAYYPPYYYSPGYYYPPAYYGPTFGFGITIR